MWIEINHSKEISCNLSPVVLEVLWLKELLIIEDICSLSKVESFSRIKGEMNVTL